MYFSFRINTRVSVTLASSISPSREHADCGGGHDRRREPAQALEPRTQGKLTHDLLTRPERHDHCYDRHCRDAVDDRAPKQSLDGIERREIEHRSDQTCRRDDAVKPLGSSRTLSKPDSPLRSLADRASGAGGRGSVTPTSPPRASTITAERGPRTTRRSRSSIDGDAQSRIG